MKKFTSFAFDAPKVERVVSNLLENASKFTPAGGTVWLHAEPYMWERRAISKPAVPQERRRRPSAAPNSVKISVSDTGPGIPPEYHMEIFDDFFRLPTKRNSPKAWVWGWPSRAVWSMAWAARSGWRASPAPAASFLSSFH